MVRRLTYPSSRIAGRNRRPCPEMPLLDVPEDLRQRIWETVFLDSPDAISLLQTCHQIQLEAQPLVFQRPLSFRSQSELELWLSSVDTNYTSGVRVLHMTLQDLDSLPAGGTGHQSWPSVSLLELYRDETERIATLLSKFPSITDFSLSKPETIRSYYYNDFYFTVARKVATELPGLHGFTYFSDEHSFEFVKSLHNLRRFSFTGYSKNTPMETQSVLSRLRHLEELEIILPRTPTVLGGLEMENAFPKSQSLTREVIRDLRGLKSFTLRERLDQYDPSPVFCTSRIIQALESGHRNSLQTLTIDLDFVPDVPCQRAIQALCKTSTLRHIDIIWPGIRADLANSLPMSLVSLRTSPLVGRPPYWVMLVLQWKKAELPNMRELSLVGDFRSSPLSPQVRCAFVGIASC